LIVKVFTNADSEIVERGKNALEFPKTPKLRGVVLMKAEMKNRIEEMKSKVKAGFWWLVSGAIIAMIIGFVWGGWTTSSTTQKTSDEAVLASQAAICVAQFMKDPTHQEKLKEFAGMDSWKRYELIENGGWDKMPGQEKASHSVSRACVAGIEVLAKK
jgi:hypothetical protein